MNELANRLSALSPAQRALLELRIKKRQPAAGETIPIRQQGNDCPLSLDQERIWFIQQLDPDSPAYNIYSANRFAGLLDVGVLTRSLNEIVRRHEIMRTTFDASDRVPVQIIVPSLTVDIPLVDLRALPHEERETEAERLASHLVQRPFDLTRLPLFRSILLRVDDEDYVCATVFHHIITDWVSFHIFERELALLYAAFMAGEASPLEELPIQYADFAVWQRRWLAADTVAPHLAYWRQQLAGAPLVLDLPRDRPRPVAQTPWGYRQPLVLSKAHSDAIRRIAQQEEVTLFIALLAIFKALLFRLTGQEKLIVGSPIANRNRVETEGLLGFFINQLVLCTDFSGNPTFRELLRRVREVALGAYAHQEMPFGTLVEELQPERALSHTPLTQVVFLFLNPQQEGILQFAGLDILPYAVDSKSSKFDMTLSLWDSETGFEGWIEYNTDLFDASTVVRMATQFRTLLAGIVADPDQRISDLPILTEAMQHQLLVEWSASNAAAVIPAESCVQQLFEARVEEMPDAVAIEFDDEKLSYGELNRRANQLAHYLRSPGVGLETPVGILMERSPGMIVALLAVLKAGGAYLPFDPADPKDRVAFMLQDAEAAVLLTESHLVGSLSERDVRVLCLDTERKQIAAEREENPPNNGAAGNLAYIIYTSGSTGRPKGVAIEHRGLVNLIAWHQSAYDVKSTDRATLLAGQAFDASVWELWPYLAAGASIQIPNEDTRSSVPQLVKWLEEKAVTLCFLPTPLAEAVLDELAPATSHLRCLLTGGDTLHRRPGTNAPFSFVNHYGPTENTVVTTASKISATTQRDAALPIGRPIANTQVYLLDPHLQPVPLGVAGELYIAGAGLARCYLNRPELTAEKFIPHKFSDRPGARMYRTGDLARYLSDGQIEFLGRVDDQVKIRGFRIEVGEIEVALCEHEAVREAIVVAHEDVRGTKRLAAYIVPARKDAGSVELREYLKERVPDYMVPTAFVMLGEMPLTRNGKVDRRKLPPVDSADQSSEKSFVAPRTVIERQLAEIWCQLLGLDRVGIHDNFFELGGDSILSIQIIARANRAGLQLASKHLFQHQTVAELAMVAGKGQAVQAEQGTVTGNVPLTPIQHWFFEQNLADAHHFNQSLLLELREEIEPQRWEAAVRRVFAHHDALHLRFAHAGGIWQQMNATPDERTPYTCFDLSELAEDEQDSAVGAISAALQEGLNLFAGPVARVAMFDLGTGKSNWLLLIIHHLVMDGISWRILLEDLHTACDRLRSGRPIQLPVKTTSFKRWAERLIDHSRSTEIEGELAYWTTAARSGVESLPLDRSGKANTVASARTVEVSLDVEQTRELLQEVPIAYRARINDVLLTALALALKDWTGERPLIVDLERHGREDIFEDVDLSRTVGWFTTICPVLLDLEGANTVPDALKTVKEQLRGVPSRGLGYGLLRYLRADEPGVERLRTLPQAEVSFNYLGQLDRTLPETTLFASAREAAGFERSPRAARRYLFEVNGSVAGGRFILTWTFSENLHHRSTIEKLTRKYIDTLKAIIAEAKSSEVRGYALSDFPLARLDRQEFDQLAARYPALEDIYPLSPIQQGLLFHTLSAPESSIYTEQVSCELIGELDVSAFERAWQQVVNRHSILRTSFLWNEFDEPLQIVHRRVGVVADVHELRGLTVEQQQDHLKEFLVADRARGFDPSVAPLMRLSLFRTGERSYQYVWSHHHLLLDGWSVPLVHKEVLEHYEALHRGGKVEVEPARPYRAYIEWLLRQDQSEAESYWGQMLKGFRAPTPLGADHVPTEASREAAFGDEIIQISQATTGALQSLARQHRLTLNTLIEGGWAILLSQSSGMENVLFGVTTSGRPAEVEGIETMVGLFINTLPVRVDVSREASVLSWLKQLQTRHAEMRQYTYSPLVQERSDMPLGRPLFESLLVFENAPVGSVLQELSGNLEVIGLQAPVRTMYPITLVAVPGAELLLNIAYHSQRFEPQTIAAVLEHLQTLLAAIAAEPQQRISSLPALPERGRPRFTLEWQARPPRSTAYVGPRTPIEEKLVSIWGQVLGLDLEQISIYDNFFEMGGHSLIATQFVSRMREIFKIELPLRYVFEATTIAELASRVETAVTDGLPLQSSSIQPAPRDGNLPVSLTQKPLWFLDQVLPGNSVFNVPAAVQLSGSLNLAVLEQSLNEILRRHEALRTTFAQVEGEGVQIVAEANPSILVLTDLRELAEPARSSEMVRVTAEESLLPFDLAQGPLLRINLLRLNDNEYRALVTMHHIIADDWAMGIFIRELMTLYEAFSHGRPSPLPKLPIQYVDYSIWQRQQLQDGRFESQLAFWRKQLEGPLETLELPTDYPRQDRMTFSTSLQKLRLPDLLFDAVKDASRTEGVTPFMLLMTALQILLYRYTGKQDIRVGTLVANRNRAEIEGLIGLFVNTLVVRTAFSEGMTHRQVLQQVRENVLGAFNNQDLPFELLIQELERERELDRASIFEVLFVLQNAPMQELELTGLTVHSVDDGDLTEPEITLTTFDLVLMMWEGPDGLAGSLRYKTDLFQEATINRLLQDFQDILAEIAEQPADLMAATPPPESV